MRRVGIIIGCVWVAAAFALFLTALLGPHGWSGRSAARAPVGTSGRLETTARVQPFLQFAHETQASDRALPPMTVDHAYTAEGLRRLADALAALSADASTVDQIRRAADAITADPASLHHADAVRGAFGAAARNLGRLDPKSADRLRRQAEEVNARRRLLRQKRAVRSFFEAAAAAIRDGAPRAS